MFKTASRAEVRLLSGTVRWIDGALTLVLIDGALISADLLLVTRRESELRAPRGERIFLPEKKKTYHGTVRIDASPSSLGNKRCLVGDTS